MSRKSNLKIHFPTFLEMSRAKKQEVITELESHADFERCILFGEGLAVLDAYPSWTGPVKAVRPLFSRLKIESGNDTLLNFYTIPVEATEHLETYAGTIPEPLFLVYSAGVLIARQRGLNAPLLEKIITEKLKLEHEIIESEKNSDSSTHIQRQAIENFESEEYRHLSAAPNTAVLPKSRLEKVGSEKQQLFGIIKPNLVDKFDEIIEKLKSHDIHLLKSVKTTLTAEQLADLYFNKEIKSEFLDFMTSGDSILLLLETLSDFSLYNKYKDLAVSIGRELLADVYDADQINDGFYVAVNEKFSEREVGMFFPNTVGYSKSVCLLRPEANEKGKVLEAIKSQGFHILQVKDLALTKDQVEKIYDGNKNYEEIYDGLTKGEVKVLLLVGKNALEKWSELIDGELENSVLKEFISTDTNLSPFHGPSNDKELETYLQMFFPEHSASTTYVIIKPDAFDQREAILENILADGFEIGSKKELTLDENLVKKIYSQVNI